ncbi:MAG: glycosyltransferase [Bacteroidales bacterium]|nr:glycosyltransferase [Bacteroidales bacterium]
MGKSFTVDNHGFTVISDRSVRKNTINENLQKCGEIDGIKYKTTAPNVFSSHNYLKKVYSRFLGTINEFFYVIKNIREFDSLIIYSCSFSFIVFYSFIFKLFRKNSYLVYFELRSSLDYRSSLLTRINDYFLDNKVFKFVSGVITISESLNNHVRSKSAKTSLIKIPPLVDFDQYDALTRNPDIDYFLYCGSLSYLDVVNFILDSFERLGSDHNTSLYLVVNGYNQDIIDLESVLVKRNLASKVKVLSGVDSKELIQLYKNAFALLIPLRPTKQDTSRFPQKVAEYCASKRPIISTRIGEMVEYFDDSSAFFAEEYDVEMFSQQMQKAIQNSNELEEMGKRSYEIGMKNFNYKNYTTPLLNFMGLKV